MARCPNMWFKFDPEGSYNLVPASAGRTSYADGHHSKFSGWPIPCGKCEVCLKNRAREWSVRLLNELELNPVACFLTLTYDEDSLPLSPYYMQTAGRFEPTLVPEHLTKFWKRLRKRFSDRKIRYYAVGEYGSKSLRPHYHAVVFGWRPDSVYRVGRSLVSLEIEDLWPYGQNVVGSVGRESIHYVCGYLVKSIYKHSTMECPPFSRMSQGLGLAFAMLQADKIESLSFHADGRKAPVPRYYLKKLEVDLDANPEYLSAMAKHEAGIIAKHREAFPDLEPLESIKRARDQALRNVRAKNDLLSGSRLLD